MKKIALLCSFFLLLVGPLLAQSNTEDEIVPDERLLELYSQKHIDKLMTNQPNIIAYWNYFLDHSYFIENPPVSKANTYPNLEDAVLTNPETGLPYDVSMEVNQLNVKLFHLEIQKNKRVSYRLGDTGKLITFYSKDEFLANYNALPDAAE